MIWDHAIYALQTLAGYFVLCVFLPSLCLYRFVEKKSFAYRFVFYQAAANIYLNLIGFLLAYCKIFNTLTVWLFVGLLPLAAAAFIRRKQLIKRFRQLSATMTDVITQTYGLRIFFKNAREALLARLKRFYKRFLKNRLLEWILLILGLAFLVWFYGDYKLHNAGYGHTDEETHLYWIQSIFENNAFPTGLYPHGMHFLVAIISCFFGISPVGSYLNFSIVSLILIFIFLYIAFRKIFRSRYAVVFGWGFFLITNIFAASTYFRFQISFPMEFGFVPLMATIYGLVSYFKDRRRTSWWLFAMSLAWGFYAHFYITIFTAFLCAAFGLLFLIPMWKKKILHKVLLSGLAGIMIALAPFGAGFLAGHPFERSISWALGVMGENAGEDTEEGTNEDTPAETEEENTFSFQNLPDLDTVITYMADSCFTSRDSAKAVLLLLCILTAYGLIGLVVSRKRRMQYLLYLFLALSWVFSLILYLCYFVGLPVLIEMKRMSTFLSIMCIPLFVVPFQILADLLMLFSGKKESQRFQNITLLILGVFLLGSVWKSGAVKEERYYEITISEADALLCMELLHNADPFTWTVISPTNDLAMIRNSGYHYEILDLLEEVDSGQAAIYIPTQYVYVVVENLVTDFNDSRREIDGSDRAEMAVPVSPEYALDDSVDVYTVYGDSPDRAYYFSRKTVMSRLYYWMEKVKEAYPQEVSVYYEDSTCTVYQIEQDEYFLLNLAVKYRTDLEERVAKDETS
ncbi:glycosyltransferase family protein [Massiliimalia massiliensis]|uniref:ECF transporter S component n=1 Tax=Massiliimalia massiliensis TaxID=1852384 RepID=UPI0009860758|nr:ECF transporter S component [Massiliimalia massiliensis]